MSVSPCPPPSPPTFGVVVFDPTAFKAAFPEFATVADAALNMNFSLATMQLNNTCGSRVCDAAQRETLFNLLVAHITQLRNGINGDAPAGIVGRVDKATEGSVSVSASMGTEAYGQPYYDQTQWGAMYWAATARFRTAIYVAPPAVCADFAGGVNNPIGFGFFPNSGNPGCGC